MRASVLLLLTLSLAFQWGACACGCPEGNRWRVFLADASDGPAEHPLDSKPEHCETGEVLVTSERQGRSVDDEGWVPLLGLAVVSQQRLTDTPATWPTIASCYHSLPGDRQAALQVYRL